MDCSRQNHILTSGQDAFLNAFFTLTQEFYLTGGTALAGFYLGHRTSVDLDLFTQSDESFSQFEAIMADVARVLSCSIEAVRTTHYFKHYQAHMPDGPLTIHSAHDIDVRVAPVRKCGAVCVDSIEDITANKICALLGRAAMKDLTDLYFLDKAGFHIGEWLQQAQRKDGGLTRATLAYAFDQMTVDALPTYVTRTITLEELVSFKTRIVDMLSGASFPSPRHDL